MELTMYAFVTNMVLATVVLMVVRAETYAMLEAVAYARKLNGSLVRKLQIGGARYEWASVLWHETAMPSQGLKAAYSIMWPLALGMATFVSILAAMFFELLPADPSLAFMLGTLTGVGFFGVAYGPSFAASRANVAEQQHAGTWQLA